MKTLQINTNDIRGGAGRAAFRLFKGLKLINEQSYMFVREKESTDPSVVQAKLTRNDGQIKEESFLCSTIQDIYINKNRTSLSNTLFSFAYPGYDLTKCEIVLNADIINLHWINYFQSLTTIKQLLSLSKPVIWTFHDQWAFTGGCHYSAGCIGYINDCLNCPQLSNDNMNLAPAILRDKIELFKGSNLTVVTPSRWMAECAKKSKVFRNSRVETIGNSLETDIFSPNSRDHAKKSLNIPRDALTLLFGAEYGYEKRKGFKELLNAIRFCSQSPAFKRLSTEGKIRILCFGNPNEEISALSIPVTSLGYVNSDQKMRDVYNAADIFILPSLEDNLPNTMLEAMSCGVPVVAFDIGGMPDFIANGSTGALAPIGDVEKMGASILDLIFNNEKRELMGKNCRRVIEEKCTLVEQARRYRDLYAELLGHRHKFKLARAHQYSAKKTAPFLDSNTANLETLLESNTLNFVVTAFPENGSAAFTGQLETTLWVKRQIVFAEDAIKRTIYFIIHILCLSDFYARHEPFFRRAYHNFRKILIR